MVITAEAGALFDRIPRNKYKAFLLYITIFNACASSNLKIAAHHAGKHLADAIEQKTSIGVRSLLPTSSFLSLYRRVLRLAQTCMPSLKNSPSDK